MNQVYQLKITLAKSKPSIWRRILVPLDFTLNKLHDVIQGCFEWDHSHLYSFEIHGQYVDDEDEQFTQKLNQLALTVKSKFKYTYDFGDNWVHDILIEKLLPLDGRKKCPLCLSGERAGPPEDSGGIGGYEDYLQILSDKNHPDYDDVLEWMGDDVHPEMFDVESINKRLRRLR